MSLLKDFDCLSFVYDGHCKPRVYLCCAPKVTEMLLACKNINLMDASSILLPNIVLGNTGYSTRIITAVIFLFLYGTVRDMIISLR